MLGKTVLLLTITLSIALAQNQWAYQEDASLEKKQQNAEDKRPLIGSSTRCLTDEYLYPGDQANDYVCDCKPGFLYVPTQNRCYPAYYRNTCPPGNYLVLPKNKPVPKCERNSCYQHGDGFVPFMGGCYKLNEVGPCQPAELGTYVNVNEVTLTIECRVPAHLPAPPTKPARGTPTTAKPEVIVRIEDDEEGEKLNENTAIYPEKACFIGGRRALSHLCVQTV